MLQQLITLPLHPYPRGIDDAASSARFYIMLRTCVNALTQLRYLHFSQGCCTVYIRVVTVTTAIRTATVPEHEGRCRRHNAALVVQMARYRYAVIRGYHSSSDCAGDRQTVVRRIQIYYNGRSAELYRVRCQYALEGALATICRSSQQYTRTLYLFLCLCFTITLLVSRRRRSQRSDCTIAQCFELCVGIDMCYIRIRLRGYILMQQHPGMILYLERTAVPGVQRQFGAGLHRVGCIMCELGSEEFAGSL
mmetsp:Transcript_20416/g.31237  ORF Transcript_20416/g.31237 Transcript_20416/m.31237 type:complete len:250 (+) Transcript_20416:1412-2161(+)